MKILFCVLYYEPAWAYGGPPRLAYDLARGLASRGHEVTVCTTDAWDRDRRLTAGEQESNGVKVVRFRNLSNRLAFHLKVFLPLAMRRWLRQRAADFDVIHLFDTRTLQNAWASAEAVRAGVPFVTSVWGSLPRGEGWRSLVKAHYDARHLPRQLGAAAALLAQNEHEAALYRDYGGDPARVVLWPLAVDPTEFATLPPRGSFRARQGWPESDRLVLFVGRLHQLKGLDLLIEAFARARARVPEARLVVVGRDDGYQGEMLALAARLGVGDRVSLMGPLYGADVLPAYVDCDLFCITPHHFEETSLAALTAAACGRPVLINDRCGIPWLEDYGAGRTVPHQREALADALAELLRDRAQLERIGAGARHLIEERFFLPRILEQLEGIYQRALEQPGGRMNEREFFDRQHTAEQRPLPLHFRLLRRFEQSRESAVAALLPGGRAMLDVGCGDGTLARQVAGRYDGITATDVSPAVLAEAQQATSASNIGNIRFAELDANRPLPYPDAAFDTVVSLSTLQYLFDPEAFLAEVSRVLAPGGTLVVEVPNMAYLPQRLRLLAGLPIRTSFWTKGIDGGNLHYFTGALLAALVRRAGMTVDKLTGSGVFASIRSWRPGLLCGNLIVRGRR